jgi:hypothetical protein
MRVVAEKVARVFEDVNGYYFCDNTEKCLDMRGTAHPTKISVMRAAYRAGYTYCTGSGSYHPFKVRRISSMIFFNAAEVECHEKEMFYMEHS